MQLISGFVDTYLTLNQAEETAFQRELKTFQQEEQEEVMEIVTSWMTQGIEREKALIIRLIKRKLGHIYRDIEVKIRELNIDKIEELGEALFDFSTLQDLENWLNTTNQ
ncbi:DUF4351 domain-containing protein [Aphanothece sacrum]|nr:DUF4351 domain-containing protein [Aphanothece sacrum]